MSSQSSETNEMPPIAVWKYPDIPAECARHIDGAYEWVAVLPEVFAGTPVQEWFLEQWKKTHPHVREKLVPGYGLLLIGEVTSLSLAGAMDENCKSDTPG